MTAAPETQPFPKRLAKALGIGGVVGAFLGTLFFPGLDFVQPTGRNMLASVTASAVFGATFAAIATLRNRRREAAAPRTSMFLVAFLLAISGAAAGGMWHVVAQPSAGLLKSIVVGSILAVVLVFAH